MKNILSLLTKFSNKLNNVLGIKTFGFITAISPFLYYIYSLIFSFNCQNLYHIPAKYFNVTLYDILPYGSVFLLIIIAFLYNAFFYKNDKGKYNLTSKLLYLGGALVPGFIFSIIELTLFYIFALNFDWEFEFLNSYYSIIVIYIIMLILGIFSFVKFPDNIRKPSKFKEIIKKIILIISILVKTTVIICFFVAFLNATPTNKSYETTSINDKDYVILSEDENNYLVVEYNITKETTYFFTSEYQWIDKEGIIIQLSKLSNIECK